MWKKIYEPSPGFQEAYSTKEMCDEAFNPIIDKLQNKKICCPCDSDESAIVIWLKEHTNSEITYFCTKDITKKPAQAIMKKNDIIITDPPFNEDGEIFVSFLKENDLKYVIFGHRKWKNLFGLEEHVVETHRAPIWEHRLRDGRPYKVVGTWYTNIKDKEI